MKEKLKTAWEKLPPVTKRKVVAMGIVVLVIVMALGAYGVKSKNAGVAKKTDSSVKKELTMDQHLLEKSAYQEGKKEMNKVKEEVQQLVRQQKEGQLGAPKPGGTPGAPGLVSGVAQQQPQSGVQVFNQTPSAQQMMPGQQQQMILPPAATPPVPTVSSRKGVADSTHGANVQEKEESIGGIETSANNNKTAEAAKDEKKKKRTIFLPPSFMQATLLSGLDAPAVESAKKNPMPVLLRIKDLAVLPNSVKQNLKGCFVIAEGSGNLADERVHLRLVTLSCLSRKGKSIINHSIKGFVVGEDGKIGIRGTVASKMGAVVVRSLLAGFITGFGDAFKQSTFTSSISALGTTQTIDPDKIAKAGFGQGVSAAAQNIQKFFDELARQTVPVVQVGATREMTLVVSEGIELEIKSINVDYAGG